MPCPGEPKRLRVSQVPGPSLLHRTGFGSLGVQRGGIEDCFCPRGGRWSPTRTPQKKRQHALIMLRGVSRTTVEVVLWATGSLNLSAPLHFCPLVLRGPFAQTRPVGKPLVVGGSFCFPRDPHDARTDKRSSTNFTFRRTPAIAQTSTSLRQCPVIGAGSWERRYVSGCTPVPPPFRPPPTYANGEQQFCH